MRELGPIVPSIAWYFGILEPYCLIVVYMDPGFIRVLDLRIGVHRLGSPKHPETINPETLSP